MGVHVAWSQELAVDVIARHVALEGALLPMLHALQHEFGYIHDEAIPLLAQALNLSRAEIFGCLSFYHDFRRAPPGRHELKLCRAEACQAVGSEALHAAVLSALETGWHGTTADGQVSVEPVFCLGLCACAPAALLDGAPLARLTPASLDLALATARAAAA